MNCNCMLCGRPFKTYRKNPKFCSRPCTIKGRKKRKDTIPNNIIIKSDWAEIVINETKVALIDLADVPLVQNTRWYLSSHYYIKSKEHTLHNYLLNYKSTRKYPVDHINGNPLDNRRANLRLTTMGGNLANQKLANDNTSGYKGVSFHKGSNKWQAKITVDYKQIYIGTYDNIEEAVEAYDQAAVKHFGNFALTNKMLKARK